MCIDFQYKFESGKNLLFSREYLYWFSIQKNDRLKSIAKSIEIVILIWLFDETNIWDFNDENLWDFDDENRIDISVEKWCDQKQTDFKLKYLFLFSTQKRATISSNSSSKCTVN